MYVIDSVTHRGANKTHGKDHADDVDCQGF